MIKNFEDKALWLKKDLTKSKKNAIVEDKYCYPEYGIIIKARNKQEADKKLKKIIK